MRIKSLFEEFKMGVKHNNKYYEIFYSKNGESLKKTEMDTLSKFNDVRFMIDCEKDIAYFWNNELLHVLAAGYLNEPYSVSDFAKRKFQIWGEAEIVKDTFHFIGSFNPLMEMEQSMNAITVLRYAKALEKKDCKSIKLIVGLKEEMNRIFKKADRVISRNNIKI